VVDVLPNRPDLLSHMGIAREIAALTSAEMHLPDLPGVDHSSITETKRFRRAGNAGGIVLHLEDAKLATRYMGVVIRGVKVGPSPQWLVDRLAAVGSRSINNIVDATNYVLHEMGQPTHAFDLAKVDPEPKMPEKTIVVRSAKEGETLVTLDGVTRKLTPEMTVIADSRDPIALAGVMGGQSTEVSDETTDLFVEVANFDPRRTRITRRAAGLSTDASYRFERGVDVSLPWIAIKRVASLIISLAGGQVAESPVDLYAGDPPHVPVLLRTARVARVLGVALDAERVAHLLKAIGCIADVDDAGAAIHVVAPTWRRDLVAEVDLIEEVARLHGYDALPDEIRPYRPGTTSDAPLWTVAAKLRDALSGVGLLEARPTPFVAGGEKHVRVLNPLAENEGHLRRTVLESLERRAEYNLTHMQGNVRLYEIGSAFERSGEALPLETLRVALLVMGHRDPAHFTNAKPEPFGVWDAKGLAELVAHIVAPGNATLIGADERTRGREDERTTGSTTSGAVDTDVLWDIVIDGETRGSVSRVPLDAPVWASPAYGVELVLGRVSNADVATPGEHAHTLDAGPAHHAPAKYRPLPTTPASEFDLALLVPDGLRAEDVERVIRAAAGDLLERLVAFDVYEGAGVEPGTRSVAWRLTLRHPERTLRDKEIEGRRSKILSALQNELNVRQRST
jgi:phenylalanyl-tRNA synthetase beta chain